MKHLVLVGGGHAHMTVMRELRTIVSAGHAVTLVSPDPFHYYSGMGPGMLGGFYEPEEIRFHVRKMVEDRGGRFREGKAVAVRPEDRQLLLEDGELISYDVISFNIGSSVPPAGIRIEDKESVFTVKPIVGLVDARERIRSSCVPGRSYRIVVIGGGPAGAEVAGNVWQTVKNAGGKPAVTVIAGRRFLPGLPPTVSRRVRNSFARRSITIIEGQRAASCGPRTVILADGRDIPCDLIFVATGVRPPSLFADSGLPVGGDGGLLVNASLQSVRYPEIYGGGDCISFEPHPLDKVGVYAVRQNPVLMHNLLAALDGQGDMKRLEETGPYLLIFNLGDGTAVFWKKGLVFNGRVAFRLKDYIDRKFMRVFQVSGEQAR